MKRVLHNERGLTLIELCLTLLILALIIALASPRLSRSYESLKLKTAAESVADEIGMMQKRAELSEQAWRFIVWPDGRGYNVERQSNGEPTEPNSVADARASNWEIVVRRTLPKDVNLTPPGVVVEWTVDGVTVNQKFNVCSKYGNSYEICIEEGGIVLRLARQDILP